MRAALLTDYRAPLELRERAALTAGPQDAVLAVRACGICRSDWHVWHGDWQWRMPLQLPHVLGHECAGEVLAVGPEVRDFAVGDRVTLPFHLSCGDCAACDAGDSNLCVRYDAIGFHRDGAFAEQMLVPNADRNLLQLPEGVSYADAASLGCRYASAFHGLERAGLIAGETVAVFGCGGVGLSAVQLAAGAGATVVAVDLQPDNLALAARLGARYTVRSAGSAQEIADAVREAAGGPADLSVDAVGSAITAGAALRSLRSRGRHLQLGLSGEEERGQYALPMDLAVKAELQIIGAVGCPRPAFERLLAAVAGGQANPSALVTRTVGLDGITGVLEEMSEYRTSGITLWSA